MTSNDKEQLKRDLVSALSADEQVEKIIIFGSFVTSASPDDIDVAVFCASDESYLPLALSFRKRLRSLARKIPVDLLPICRPYTTDSAFMSIIEAGEVIYEKGH